MCRGSSPYQKLLINNAISDELCWLANHIELSDGVHIIESKEWARSDAHDTYLSDACPSGTGFWSTRTCEGFQCAIPVNTRNGIFFFEALAVLLALHHVCEHVMPKPCRLAILTDSSNTFDMFNSLHTLLAYNPILITAVDLMLKSGVQLHVFHIPQSENKVADALSQLDGSTARQLQPDLVISNFTPPRLMLGEVSL